MTRTVELHEARSLPELIGFVEAGDEVLLIRDQRPVARIVAAGPATAARRTAGLHRGAIVVSEDFDEPLPDTFWTA